MWTNNPHRPISDQDFDVARASMTSAKANWQAAIEKAAVDASKVVESRAQVTTAKKLYEQAGAQVSQAEADVRAAELDLSYTKIVAPVDGRITRKMVEQGAYIQVAQSLLAIVRPDVWVTANFKETQITKMHKGQAVTIKVDAIEGRSFRGHVDSIQSGSGSRFSLLPPENAVGNYVKVVQRVPVKIVFDEPIQAGEGLGPGVSAEPIVAISSRSISDAQIMIAAIVVALLCSLVTWMLIKRRPTV